jgi:hypothetical protein
MMGRLKKTLEVFDLVDLQSICLPDGGEKYCLGGLDKEFEELVSYFHGVLAFGLSLLKEGGDTFIHSVHELMNSLGFEVRGDLKQSLPMGGMFDFLLSIKTSWMEGHPFAFDPDLHLVGIKQQFTRGFGEGGGNRVAIRVKLDKTGFTDLSKDQLMG